MSLPPPDADAEPPVHSSLEPGLYVVSTPIGNLRDVTLRALDVLKAVNLILAEDTRVTRKLLDAFQIRTPMASYHEHNAAEARPRALAALAQGEALALVSDAGTPLISDPGYKLVEAALAEGRRVIPIPGASAALAALVAAGLPTDRFFFAGFPPPRQAARRKALAELTNVPATLVFYEGVSRLSETLADMAEIFGDRPAAVARELTKRFETVRRGTLSELAAAFSLPPKGEVAIVVGPPLDRPASAEDLDVALQAALARMSLKEAAAAVAAQLGAPRKAVYARALQLKGE